MTEHEGRRSRIVMRNVVAENNSLDGIAVGGVDVDIKNARTFNNGRHGLNIGDDVSGVIDGVYSAGNGGAGVLIGLGPIGLDFGVPKEQLKEVADILKTENKSKWPDLLEKTDMVAGTADKAGNVIAKIIDGYEWILSQFF